jgi:ACT domain-containing protein
VIRPVLIDREMPRLQAKLDELNKLSTPATTLTAEQKKEFIEVTKRLKLLTDRRALLLVRIGDEYVTDPPRLAAKP